MNFSKKNRSLVGQNEANAKRSQKHEANLQKNSTLYFQVGLIITLLITYSLFEMQFAFTKPIVEDQFQIEEPDVFAAVVQVAEEPKPEKKVVKQTKRKLITRDPIVVNHPIKNEADPEPLFTEPLSSSGPAIDPDDLTVEKEPDEVVFNVIGVEQVPIYPGCEKLNTNTERRLCMEEKLSKLVKRKFNTGAAQNVGISGRHKIDLGFTIDEFGEVTNIKIRTPFDPLKKEANKVANLIPKMTPGKQKNKNVKVTYYLPIIVEILD